MVRCICTYNYEPNVKSMHLAMYLFIVIDKGSLKPFSSYPVRAIWI